MLSSPLCNYRTMSGGEKSVLNLLTSADLFAGAFLAMLSVWTVIEYTQFTHR